METKLLCNVDSLMNPSVKERFQRALAAVMDNIFDSRSEAVKPRSVTLTFSFVPDDNRTTTALSADVTFKTAKLKPIKQTMSIRRSDDGSMSLIEQTAQVPGQVDMNGRLAPLPNVIKMNRAAANDGE